LALKAEVSLLFSARAWATRLISGVMLAAIRFISAVSPNLAPMCRYQPTCSAYAYEAIERYGPPKGSGWPPGAWCAAHPLQRRLGPVPDVPRETKVQVSRCLRARSPAGNRMRERCCPSRLGAANRDAVELRGRLRHSCLLVSARDGKLDAIDPQTGERWRFPDDWTIDKKAQSCQASTPCRDGGRQRLRGDYNGYIYAFSLPKPSRQAAGVCKVEGGSRRHAARPEHEHALRRHRRGLPLRP
jgi:putative component of membrane protein insertase Oxa1/YidC/SpoIIIJ protein YidD